MNVVRHVLVILSVVRALGLGDLEDQRVLAALLLARKVDPFLAWGYGMSPADLEVVLAIAKGSLCGSEGPPRTSFQTPLR